MSKFAHWFKSALSVLGFSLGGDRGRVALFAVLAVGMRPLLMAARLAAMLGSVVLAHFSPASANGSRRWASRRSATRVCV